MKDTEWIEFKTKKKKKQTLEQINNKLNIFLEFFKKRDINLYILNIFLF